MVQAVVKKMKETKELTLREYQMRDVPRIVEIICNAMPQLPNYKMITPEPKRIQYVLENNIANGSAFACWVMCDSHDRVQGGGGGWCVMNLMSYDMVADDIFMWIEPEYRSLPAVFRLVHTYVDWAKARGAKLIRASHTGGSFKKGSKDAELYDKLLKRLGFDEVGSVYHYSAYGEK